MCEEYFVTFRHRECRALRGGVALALGLLLLVLFTLRYRSVWQRPACFARTLPHGPWRPMGMAAHGHGAWGMGGRA